MKYPYRSRQTAEEKQSRPSPRYACDDAVLSSPGSKGDSSMRRFVYALAAALAFAAPASAETVLKVSLHSDLKIIDPIWTTALISAHHGNMVYDTLFALDDKLVPKPQMVDKWEVSPDKLTWTFTLRDGLEWHDGQPVTAADCVASLKRWGAKEFDGPEADGRDRRAFRARRQDDQDGAEGALRPGARFHRQGGGERRLHDAQAHRRDRRQHPDHRRHAGPADDQTDIAGHSNLATVAKPQLEAAGFKGRPAVDGLADAGLTPHQEGTRRPRAAGALSSPRWARPT